MLTERIKNEAQSIKKILDKDKSLGFYSKIENSAFLFGVFLTFIANSIFAYFYFNLNYIPESIAAFSMLFLITGFFLGYIKIYIFEFINSIWKKKILGDKHNSNNKIFKNEYYIKKTELIKYNNLYKSLSNNAKLILENCTVLSPEISIKEIESRIFEKEILDLPISNFINYFKSGFNSDINEFEINKNELLEKKINKELKNINKEDFDKYKNDLVYLVEKIENSAVELTILKKIEELKLKYDNIIINKEIEKVKKNIQYKKDNKILKSI